MSERTIVFIREKGTPLLKYRETPSNEERQGKTEKEITELFREVEAYNLSVDDSLGLKLIYLYTASSQRLSVLPLADDPKPLTMAKLDKVLTFYDEKIKQLSEEAKTPECEEKLKDCQDCLIKFKFVKDMMNCEDNKDRFELAYRKF